MKVAKELGDQIAKNPPLAVKFAKSQLYQAMIEPDMIRHMEREVETMEQLMKTADFLEAATAFLQKREPIFKGE
jgi:enoyl-CoA hydratase/carnithine racemase